MNNDNVPLFQEAQELRQERDDARRWARAWKASARKWSEEHDLRFLEWIAVLGSARRWGRKWAEGRYWAAAWKRGMRRWWDNGHAVIAVAAGALDERDEALAQVGALRGACESALELTLLGETPRQWMLATLEKECQAALALPPPAALEELEARVRGEERERCAGYLDTQAAKQDAPGTMLGAAMAGIYRKHATALREAADA